MAANSIRKYSTLVDREQIEEYLETATLGQLVGFLRYVRKMASSNFPVPDLETKLGMMILDYLLDQGRRVDHREHRDMVAYLGQVGFEIAHLKICVIRLCHV